MLSQPVSPKPVKQTKAEDDHEPVESSSSAAAPPSSDEKKTTTSGTSPPAAEATSSTKGRGEPTAASILADLQRTGDLLASTLEFFKPLSASLAHMPRNASPIASPSTDPSVPPSPPDLKIHFSEADLDALAKKMPVHLGGEDGKTSSRTLITPQGKFLWGLSKELEERVLELEKRVEEVKGIARWHPPKDQRRQNGSGPPLHSGGRGGKGDIRNDVLPAIATALKEAGAKLGKQSQSGSSPSATTPNSSKHPPKPPMSFDDALGYLNQWVLPPDTPGHVPRGEQASVGGPAPGSANLAAAAKIVAARGGDVNKIPIPDLENLGVFAAEVLGGYVVQGLEALVGPGAMGVPSYGASAYGKVGAATAAHGSGGIGPGAVLSVEEAEQAMVQSRKEAEQLEKRVNALVKRNKRMLAGNATGK